MAAPRKEQFSGCLIGQSLGDALGAPVEGRPTEICAPYVNDFIRTRRLNLDDETDGSFGQYTDDSQLARELLQSYVDLGRFDPSDYASRIAAIFAEERIVGRGQATEQAAFRLIKGVPWDEAGTPSPSAGNGTAMRAAPIGLLFFDDTDRMLEAAHDQGRITHTDARCSAGSVAIAGAVVLAMRQKTLDKEQFVSQLSEWVGTFHEPFATHILELSDWLALNPEEAGPVISKVGLDSDAPGPWKWISPFVISSVLWSLYSFLRTPDDYMETICTSIAVGGDVDTTAAMAGAISGAHLGLESLPIGLAAQITDKGTGGYAELVGLAHRAFVIKTG